MLTKIKRLIRLRNAGGHLANIEMSVYELLSTSEIADYEIAHPLTAQVINDIRLADGMGVIKDDVIRIFDEARGDSNAPAHWIDIQLSHVIRSTFQKNENGA